MLRAQDAIEQGGFTSPQISVQENDKTRMQYDCDLRAELERSRFIGKMAGKAMSNQGA